jgi:uncharacterized protein (DUF2461 family)
MEYNYKGISPESIELLCLNCFNDSKLFYEEHKEEIKQGITVPLRQLVLDLSDLLYDIDDKMYLDPVRLFHVLQGHKGSRSKIKYREDMWVFFRSIKEYPSAPSTILCFIRFHMATVGFLDLKASDSTCHKMIMEQPKRFLKAVKACADAGFSFEHGATV